MIVSLTSIQKLNRFVDLIFDLVVDLIVDLIVDLDFSFFVDLESFFVDLVVDLIVDLDRLPKYRMTAEIIKIGIWLAKVFFP